MKNLFAALSVLLLAAGCGGRETQKMTYAAQELEPKSVIFAIAPIEGRRQTYVVISDRGDLCEQFDGLGCDITQPLPGTTLSFLIEGFKAGTVTAGQARTTWRNFQAPEATTDLAVSGAVTILEAGAELEGKFTLELPRGCGTREVAQGNSCTLENEFTAKGCVAMVDWIERCNPTLR